MQTTDTPMSEEQAVEALLEPIATNDETEADEAPQEETEAEEVETEGDASEVEDENTDEAEADDESDEADDDEEEDDSEEEQPTNLYTVKVDGEERQVTLDEALRGYSGQAYIQKGMEANKTQERALAEQAQSLQQQGEAILQLYQKAQQSGFAPPPQAPPAELAKTDPIAYLEAKAAYDEASVQYEAEQQQVQLIQQQRDQQMADQRKQAVQDTERQLVNAMPELRKPETAKQFQEDLKAASAEYGFSSEEMQQIVTHYPSVRALADAAKYRRLQAEKTTAKEKRETPKAATKPKAKSKTAGVQKRRQQLRQKAESSQSIEDWAALLLDQS